MGAIHSAPIWELKKVELWSDPERTDASTDKIGAKLPCSVYKMQAFK